MTNYYEWSERYLNSRASIDQIDAANIDESIEPEWTGEHTFGAGVSLPSGEIGTGELDLSIAPTWTSSHTFDAGLTSNGDLSIAAGQSITDGTNDRFLMNNSRTIIYDEAGNNSFVAGSSNGPHLQYLQDQTNRLIWDDPNTQTAVKYTTGNPGTLETTNSHIDLSSNSLTNTGSVRGDNSTLPIRPNTSTGTTPKDVVFQVPSGSGGWQTNMQIFADGSIDILQDRLKVNKIIQSFNGSAKIDWNAGDLFHRIEEAGGSVKIEDKVNSQTVLSGEEGGNVNIPSGDVVINDNLLQGDAGSLSLSSNTMNTGGQDWTVWDTTNSQNVLRANEGGLVEVSNGDFTVSDGFSEFKRTSATIALGIRNPSTGGNTEMRLKDGDGNSSTIGRNTTGQFSIRSLVTDQSIAWFKDGGEVELPSGPLTAHGTDDSPLYVESETVSGSDAIPTDQTWAAEIHNREDAQYAGGLLVSNRWINGDTDILRVGNSYDDGDGFNEYFAVDGTGGVSVTKGPLQVVNSGFRSFGSSSNSLAIRGDDSSPTVELQIRGEDEDARFYDKVNDNAVLNVLKGGNVEIPNGSLTVNDGLTLGGGSSITSSSGNSPTLNITDQGQSAGIYDSYNSSWALEVLEGGNVGVGNGVLKLLNNSVTLQMENPNWDAGDRFYYETVGSGSGGQGVKVVHNDNSAGTFDRIFEFSQNGNFEIPNGKLKMGSSGIYNVPQIRGSNTGDLQYKANNSTSGSTEYNHVFQTYDDTVSTWQDALQVVANGSSPYVQIPNGSLTINNGIEIDLNDIIGNSSTNWNYIKTNGSKWSIYDSNNSNHIATFREGGNVEIPNGSLTQGSDPADTITETSSPKSFNFNGNRERDIHTSSDVTISNSSGSSATEDITVELYNGSDTTGTLVASETKSISVNDGSSTTATFIASDQPLDTGVYHIEVTQSGTALSIDQTDEKTRGATFALGQDGSGIGSIVTQYGNDVMRMDPKDEEIDMAGNDVTNTGGLVVPVGTDAYVST